MKFLVLGKSLIAKDIGTRLAEEGHTVILPLTIYNGIEHKPDIAVVCDNGINLTPLKAKDIPTFNSESIDDKLIEPEFAKCIAQANNLRWIKPATKILAPLDIIILFSEGEPVFQFAGCIRQTRFLTGDLGVITDCESSIVFAYANRDIKIVSKLSGFLEFAANIKYTGIVCFDTVISADDKLPYIRNFKTRFHNGITHGWLALLDMPLSKLIEQVVSGKGAKVYLKDYHAVSVLLSVPPYPYSNGQGVLRYVTRAEADWRFARKLVGQDLRALQVELQLDNIQYRVDGGLQGNYISELSNAGYC